MEKVSIIVPIYNKEEYLIKCLKSLSDQTYPEIEIILINDGSGDNSIEICNKWEKLDKRVKVISKANGGVASARNCGLCCSSGNYIMFVDPDDYLKEDCVEVLMKAFEIDNVDIAYCYAFDVYEGEEKVCTSSKESGQYHSLSTKEYNWIGKQAHTVCWGAIYKKCIINNVLFDDDLTIGEDTLFFAKCVANANKMMYVDKAEYFYFINSNSVTRNMIWKNCESELKAWKRVAELYERDTYAFLSAKAVYALKCKMMALGCYQDSKERTQFLKNEYIRNSSFLIKALLKERKYIHILKNFINIVFWKWWINFNSSRIGN